MNANQSDMTPTPPPTTKEAAAACAHKNVWFDSSLPGQAKCLECGASGSICRYTSEIDWDPAPPSPASPATADAPSREAVVGLQAQAAEPTGGDAARAVSAHEFATAFRAERDKTWRKYIRTWLDMQGLDMPEDHEKQSAREFANAALDLAQRGRLTSAPVVAPAEPSEREGKK